jgi:hypothetical protein
MMGRGKIYLYIIIFPAAFLMLASGVLASTAVTGQITEETTWTKDGSPYRVSGSVLVKAPLTIEAGTLVKFSRGSNDGLKIQSDFYVNGTREEPVIFTAIRDDEHGGDTNGDGDRTKPTTGDWMSLNFNPSKDVEMKIKYAKILYANYGVSLSPSPVQTKEISVKYSEIKKNGIGISGGDTEALIEKNVISENANEGINVNASTKKTKAINNSIANNGVGARGRNSADPGKTVLEAKYNWWGDETGPENENNPSGTGNSVSGQVTFDPWLDEDPLTFPDPVIVIPGVMASWEKDGKWRIDPIFHTYDNLCEEFLANGYEDGKNFSVFPYQWRDSNAENAKLLHKRIQDIKSETGKPKVDIVAHSMGGILARVYIESDYYEDDVDQLITVATPHLGSPKVYVKWEAGAFFSDIFETVGKHIFEQEAEENGYDSVFHYIRGRPMASVQELLPDYNYLYDDNGSDYDLRSTYPDNYPRNEFLEDLNSAEKAKALERVEFTKIIGKNNDSESTISGYNVVNADMGEVWEHGYPHGFEIPVLTDQGIKTSDGDITVPLYSAEANEIPSNKNIYLKSSHNTLPTDAQKDILEILTGNRPASEVNEWRIDDILIGMVFSPVDFQIVSPSEKRLGKNFETGGEYDEIEGAYYSGFENNMEFITVPNPENGEYRILTEGTGEGGNFKIEMTKIAENPDDPNDAKESSVIIEGEALTGERQESEVEISDDQVIYNPDNTPPEITIFSPEEKDYNDSEVLAIDYKAEDSESGIASDSWQVEKDGQILDWPEKDVDLSLEHLGNYVFKVSATDEVGNSSDKEVNFHITTNLDAIQKNLDHYFNLGLVKKKTAVKYFSRKLKNLEKIFNLLEKNENSKLKPKQKQATAMLLKKIINADINLIVRQIKKRSPLWIDPKAADLIIEDLNFIQSDILYQNNY